MLARRRSVAQDSLARVDPWGELPQLVLDLHVEMRTNFKSSMHLSDSKWAIWHLNTSYPYQRDPESVYLMVQRGQGPYFLCVYLQIYVSTSCTCAYPSVLCLGVYIQPTRTTWQNRCAYIITSIDPPASHGQTVDSHRSRETWLVKLAYHWYNILVGTLIAIART